MGEVVKMITSEASPNTERRARTRGLASITTASYDDANLDIKLEAADSYITLLVSTVPTEMAKREAFITASNLYASVLICNGIGSSESERRIKSQKMQMDDLVEAINGRRMEQFKPRVLRTAGSTSGARGFGQ